MNMPLIVFGFLLALILGCYWLFVVRPEGRTQRRVLDRLATKRPPEAVSPVLAREAKRRSDIPTLEGLLSRTRSVLDPLDRLIEQSDLRLTVGTFLLASACAALLIGLGVWYLSGSALIGTVTATLAAFLPYVYVRRAGTVRINKFEEQFPEAIDLIARALRAGHAFTTGLGMVADEMPNPAGAEFRRIYERQNYGQPIAGALKELARRIPLVDARFFVTAVLTQRESGGNLAEVLDSLGEVIRQRFKVKRQMRAASAHGRMTAWFLAGFPPLLALAFSFITPDNMKLLLTDPIGPRLLALGIGLQILGTFIVRRLVDLKY